MNCDNSNNHKYDMTSLFCTLYHRWYIDGILSHSLTINSQRKIVILRWNLHTNEEHDSNSMVICVMIWFLLPLICMRLVLKDWICDCSISLAWDRETNSQIIPVVLFVYLLLNFFLLNKYCMTTQVCKDKNNRFYSARIRDSKRHGYQK